MFHKPWTCNAANLAQRPKASTQRGNKRQIKRYLFLDTRVLCYKTLRIMEKEKFKVQFSL